MDNLYEKIIEYKNKNNLTNEECAEKLDISLEEMNSIENKETIELDSKKEKRILKVLEPTSKKIVKSMDLIFRFVAMVMALVTLLLCINENVDTKVLIVLLSIGLICSSMTILPKIEK